MIGMLVILALTNLSWFAAFFLLATRKRREGNVCSIGTPGTDGYLLIQGYSARDTQAILLMATEKDLR